MKTALEFVNLYSNRWLESDRTAKKRISAVSWDAYIAKSFHKNGASIVDSLIFTIYIIII